MGVEIAKRTKGAGCAGEAEGAEGVAGTEERWGAG